MLNIPAIRAALSGIQLATGNLANEYGNHCAIGALLSKHGISDEIMFSLDRDYSGASDYREAIIEGHSAILAQYDINDADDLNKVLIANDDAEGDFEDFIRRLS